MIHALALILSAFLLFAVQPILGKAVLPLFGGTASVWTLCLLFFQCLLLAGYSYAHKTNKKVHLVLLAISLVTLPIAPHVQAYSDPSFSILMTLLFSAGLPCFVVCSTSPLLQRWSNLDNPYRLYALSNVASLAALIGYPVLIEPLLPLSRQFQVWSVFYAVFVVLCGAAVWKARQIPDPPAAAPTPGKTRLLWILLSAGGSGLLMATTNQMCQEVASVPFLWVVPLIIYLVSFILTFERAGFYNRRIFGLLASLVIPAACALAVGGNGVPVWLHIVVDVTALFLCLIVLHGELAAAKPETGALTRFYLAVSVGGALGGIFVALVAPHLFTSFLEFPILLVLAVSVPLVRRFRAAEFKSIRDLDWPSKIGMVGLIGAVLISVALYDKSSNVLIRTRNFYGVLKITDFPGRIVGREMLHGRTSHGIQYLDPRLRYVAAAYYGKTTGVGMGLVNVQGHLPFGARIGVIGLGAGALSTYGRSEDTIRFYEINPQVIQLARQYFTYLSDCKAKVEIVEGDARLQLASEPAQEFDAIIVDAFTSDAIPMHLLTAECGLIYKRHLKPDGRLLIHISNRSLNLEPVVRGLAWHLGMGALRFNNEFDLSVGTFPASWMELYRQPVKEDQPRGSLLWSDESASLWPLLFDNK